MLQGFPDHIPWQPLKSRTDREANDEHMFVKPAWCKHQTVLDGEDASVSPSSTLERLLLSRLKHSSRDNVLHVMAGHWQAESLDGWQRNRFARDKPLSTAMHQARARATRGMQETNPAFCSHSTMQATNGA
jgi:hypothetical protein